MKDKGIFVVTSVYHILLSILLIEEYKLKQNILVMVEITPDIETLKPNLANSKWFDQVITMIGRKKQKQLAGKWQYTLNRKKIVPLIDANNPELKVLKSNLVSHDVYICSPDSAKNYFIYKYKNTSLFMIEDGLKTYIKQAPNRLSTLALKLIKRPVQNGFDQRIKTVFATEASKLPKGLKEKGKDLHWKQTLNNLSEADINELVSVFITDASLKDGSFFPQDKSKALIITQSLSEDGFVKEEADKLKIYNTFINESETDLIYIKPHPREITDYSQVYKAHDHVVVLPRLFPIELLNLLPQLYFDSGFTAFSTAIDNMTNIGKKTILGYDQFKTSK